MQEEVKYLIIGGGIAGTTCAQTLREKDPTSRIIIVSDEPHRLYSRIMLSKPNFVLGKVSPDSVFLKTPGWYELNKIELLAPRKAVQLSPQNQTVTLDDGKILHYQKLLLAIGGVSRQLDFPGNHLEGIYYLRTLDDLKKIMARLPRAKTAVVVGGGFIGFEMAEVFRLAGLRSIFLIREPYFWSNLLKEPGSLVIENVLQKGGVELFKGEEISQALGEGELQSIQTKSGKTLNCQLLVIGVGVVTPTDFLKPSGLNIKQGIVVNEYLETNLPNIWSAGDCAEFQDVVLGEISCPRNWGNAQMQGKISALNMLGEKQIFQLVSFCTSKSFGLSLITIGDLKPDETKQIFIRQTQTPPSYSQYHVKEGKIKGGVLINRDFELATLSKLILEKKALASKTNFLQDPNFDLKQL